MIGPIDPETLDNEQQKVYREVMILRQRNADRITGIEKDGVTLDLGPARVEHMISALLEFGILTVDQVLVLNKDWELELRRQTQGIVVRLDEAKREARKEAARPKLIIPGH